MSEAKHGDGERRESRGKKDGVSFASLIHFVLFKRDKRESGFHSFEKGFNYQLCLPDVVVEVLVVAAFLLIQSMKYAARLQSKSKKKRSLESFAVLIIATICVRNGDEDIKHGKHKCRSKYVLLE